MAYASLVCLANTLEENLQLHLIPQNGQYIETLLQEVSFFQDFLEKSSTRRSETIKCLESRIRDIAYKAHDIVDSYVADQLDQSVIFLATLFEEPEENGRLFHNLDEVMKEINSIKQEAIQIEKKEKEEEDNNDEPDVQPRISLSARSSQPPSHGMTKMVGLDDDFKQIKIRLGSGSLQLEIVALVGMGGIGKTTLAKKVYEDKSIVLRFDTCRWVTVTQEYTMQDILAELLGYDEMSQEIEGNLELDLYKSLKNRRYLIVLDDMWDTEVWNGLKRVLHNDGNGSRILLTTRLEKVAKYENSCPPKYMRLLDNEESWILFCETVFGEDCCPPKLKEVAKEIVENCRGLPLAVNVIGGHLSKATRTKKYWRSVAKNLCETIASEDDERWSRVLSLSYKHLPHHLKGCFLYLSIFPGNYDIKVPVLLNLWIASGLIKKERSKSFEDIGNEYFLDLVERNLILVSKLKYNGRIKTCKVHDLMRDVCVKEAKSEKLFHLTNKTLFYDYYYHHYGKVDMDAASYSWKVRASYLARLGKLHMPGLNNDLLSTLVNLRYLHDQPIFNDEITASIPELLHLQTICYRDSFILKIWEMPQLRHVKTKNTEEFVVLPDLPISKVEGGNSVIVLEKLQTLYNVPNLIFTDEALQRIPNLKKLGLIYYEYDNEATDWRDFGLHNLERLHKLKSICCCFDKTPIVLRRDITFPRSIEKLTLERSLIPWEHMTVVGSLPNLQMLKLNMNSFIGEEWEPIEGEFPKLKTLHLQDLTDLVHWRAMADHFPELQHLFIYSCVNLLEIPSSFEEIPTLQLIEVDFCRESVLSSARKIEEEQHNFGNERFQFHIIG